MSRSLIVGLGNPGRKYEGTRHNVGFEALRRLADRFRLELSRSKFDGVYTTGLIAHQDVVLLEPHTFMNRCGKSVLAARQFYDVPGDQILVFHDDIDLDCGRLKIKRGGGHGGHNGLRDIISRIGERDFVRLRLGVGRPDHGNVTGHVLGKFTSDERPDIDEMIEEACDAVEIVLSDGVKEAQNRFH